MKSKQALTSICVGFVVLLCCRNFFYKQSERSEVVHKVKRLMKGKDLSDRSLDEYMKDNPQPGQQYALYKNFPKSPPSLGKTMLVLIVTYQRSGSSFFGKIFDQNPDAFYVYEPLDALYTSIYGTEEGWNVPSDITTFWNGTERDPPSDDIEQSALFLRNLLTCRMTQLPSEFFRHKYWIKMTKAFQTKQKSYYTCLSTLDRSAFTCREMITQCPPRLGENWEESNICKEKLRENTTAGDLFIGYKSCSQDSLSVLQKCINPLTDSCNQSKMRVTKTVRATMETVKTLLDLEPDIRVINLVRDPRAVVLSRMSYFSTRGSYSKNNRIKEAEIFCRSVTKDLKLFKILQSQHTGKLIQVVYDDFVQSPKEYVQAIYDFIGSDPPKQALDWLSKNTKGKKNSTNIANRWQQRLPYGEVKLINTFCKEYMNEISYPWP